MLLRLLRAYLRPYRAAIAALVVLQLVQSLATLYLPTLNADIIDNGVITGDTRYILRTGAIMLAVTVVQIIAATGAVFFGARTAMALGRDLRHAVFQRVQNFSAREVGRFGTPSLITRTTNDVQQVQMLAVLAFTLLVSAPIMCVGGIILALHQDVPLSSLLLIAVPALGVIVMLIIGRMRPLFRVMQERIDNVNRVLREQITGIRVVRAFVRDEQERERFAGANAELFDVSLRVGRLMALMFPSVMLVAQPLQRRGAVVRRPPRRQRRHADRRADRVPQLPAADPDVGHDGHVHVHAGARGPRSAPSGSWRCWTPSRTWPARRTPVTALARHGRPGAARRGVPLPGRRAARAVATSA